MEIVSATLANIPEIMKINRSLGDLGEYCDPDILERRLPNYFVAKIKNKAVGAIQLVRGFARSTFNINTLAVAHESQRKGIGRNLVEFAKEHTEKKKGKRLTVESHTIYEAKEFYEKCGFTPMGEVADTYRFEMEL